MENLQNCGAKLSRFTLIAAALAVVSFGAMGCDDMPTSRNKKMAAMAGDSVAGLTFRDLAGKPISIDQFDDKPIVLNIWATWCKPCVAEMPSLNALAQTGKYNVIAVSADKDNGTAAAFLDEYKLYDLKPLWDPNGVVSRSQLMASSLPITYLIDTNLVLRGVEHGEREWAEMVDKIDKVTQIK